MQPRKDARDTRLYRGPKAIAGVCSGIAEYFNADVIIIRIAWILLSSFLLVLRLFYIWFYGW